MSTDLKWENGNSNQSRTLGLSDSEAATLASKLTELRIGGATCEECRWAPASVVAQRRRLLCRTCADVETATRGMDTIAARLARRKK